MIKKFFDARTKKQSEKTELNAPSEAELRERYLTQVLRRLAKGDVSELPAGNTPMEKAIREIGALLGSRRHVINGMVDLTEESGFLQHFAKIPSHKYSLLNTYTQETFWRT